MGFPTPCVRAWRQPSANGRAGAGTGERYGNCLARCRALPRDPLRLTATLESDAERARAALKALLGGIRVEYRDAEVWAVAEMHPAAILLAADDKMELVAEARNRTWKRIRIK